MSKPTYYELLRHPKWQKKRTDIMQRDGFRCTHCDADDKTLNVHHGYYRKDAMPWDYEDESLKTLCEDCHKEYQRVLDTVKRNLGFIDHSDMLRILGATNALIAREKACPGCDPEIPVGSYEEACGITDVYQLPGNDFIIEALGGDSVKHSTIAKAYYEQVFLPMQARAAANG